MRKILIILLCCTAALLTLYAGYRGYKVWKQSHMVGLAQQFMAKGDVRNAFLSLSQALRSNPRSVQASRLMAALCEATRSPEALLWRSRVVELNPQSLEDRLALARLAVAHRDFLSATNALQGVSEAGKQTAAYHNVAGTVAAAANQFDQAETHFLEASRLEPTNQIPQLSLAVVRLHGTNAESQAEARTALNRIRSDPAFRGQALRELTLDAARHQQTNSALTLSKELVQQTNSTLADRLMRLDVLRFAKDGEFRAALAGYQRGATDKPEEIYELGAWQMAKLGPADALGWLQTLPEKTQTNQPVVMLIADCLSLRQDWRGVYTLLEHQNWGALEFLRHALLTRSLRGQGLIDSAKTEWGQAVKAVTGRKEGQVMLMRLAAQWNWPGETQEILWSIVNQYPGEKWASSTLGQALFISGQTRGLMTLCSQQLKAHPSDLETKNNLAMTALLLDAQEVKPHDLAREVHEKAPTNSSYASTYAFSLHLLKKDAEALKVMESLKPQDLEKPSIAGYYGLILSQTGNASKAQRYLDLAFKAQLLPEEKKLFERARAGA